ncbi:MAG: hypothetical protein KIS87_08270 [Phycisphaeraceae bacterium]|nr:hypothetical protein [Phycisphaeraceae bacterium]
MTRTLLTAWLTGSTAWCLPALADLPPVLDRVPIEASIIVTIANVSETHGGITGYIDRFGVEDAAAQLALLEAMLTSDGMNPAGSAAFVMVAPGTTYMLLPVTNFNALVTGLGGEVANGFGSADIMGEMAYFRDLGGGYAAAGPDEDTLHAMPPTSGKMDAHTKRLGKTGKAVTEQSDIALIADVQTLRPQIEAGMEGMRQQMQFVAMVSGQAEQLGAAMSVIDALAAAVTRDGRVVLMGVDFADDGVRFDFATQFEEESPSAAFFTAPGNSGSILARLPNIPYLFAYAVDFSSPGLRNGLNEMMNLAEQADPDAVGLVGVNPFQFMQNMDGAGMVLGHTPALLTGGLMANTVAFTKTKDAPAMLGLMKQTFTNMDGKSADGVAYKTSYTPGAGEAAGVKYDAWSMTMSIDFNAPNAMEAQQMQQAMMMMFGPTGGPSGFLAATEGGLVQTMSRNSQLLTMAIESAKSGNGLGAEKGIASVAEHLPAGRSFEAYVGVQKVMESVGSVMAMMGGFPMPRVDGELPPIGLAASTHDAGLRATVYMPNKVMDVFRQLGEVFGGEDDFDAPPAGGQRPRF